MGAPERYRANARLAALHVGKHICLCNVFLKLAMTHGASPAKRFLDTASDVWHGAQLLLLGCNVAACYCVQVPNANRLPGGLDRDNDIECL
jgi:hypothetical protein